MQGSVFSLGSLIISKMVIITLNWLKLCNLMMMIPGAGNGMEWAFENQKCIEVSLVRVYNGTLVLKTRWKVCLKLPHF